MMKLVRLKVEVVPNFEEFVAYWKKYYDYPNDSKYFENINKIAHDRGSLLQMFEWKNGMTLSTNKANSFETKIVPKIDRINFFKSESSKNLADLLNEFKAISAVWQIFVFHIINPNHFPIYDQHIHRAYEFIHHGEWQTIENTLGDKAKIDFYQNRYYPFIQEYRNIDLKELDEAMFSFGQYLNTRKQNVIIKNHI